MMYSPISMCLGMASSCKQALKDFGGSPLAYMANTYVCVMHL